MTDENDLSKLAQSFRAYVQLQINILKLELVQRASDIAARLFVKLLLLCLALITLVLLTLSAGLWLGEILHSNAFGFLVLGGIYAIIFIILAARSEKLIQKPLRDRIITGLLKDAPEDNEK